MSCSPTAADLTSRRRIVVADEDPKIVEFIIKTLREDGHAAFHAYDGLSATELVFALDEYMVRNQLPNLPIMYLADANRSTPAIEAKLPRDVPILREPFKAEDLRAVVGSLLASNQDLPVG